MTRRFDLVAFDIDGTLITHPRNKTVWEVLNHRFLGDDTVNAERHALFRAGRISYEEWVSLDIQGWCDAGATRDDIVACFDALRPVNGARATLEALEAGGVHLVAISGTLDVLLSTVLPDAPFHEVYSNRIGFDADGRIRGWTATPFDMEGKAVALRTVSLRTRIPLERCAFVGDSSNDVHIAEAAGFTVAFNPRSKALERVADVVVKSDDLESVLEHL